jgi:sigma-B regulation protein RsbU (phosphoserine phosphatase)
MATAQPMATPQQTYLRSELERRHDRLEVAMQSPAADSTLSNLLGEVDAALARMDAGTYGLCEECHYSIEADRLLANPLEQFCLDHLTSAERRALESDLLLAARIQQTLLPPTRSSAKRMARSLPLRSGASRQRRLLRCV